MKLEDFTKRFNELVGENRSDFSFRTLIPYTTITNVMKGTEPRISMILAILEAIPEISAEWLMRGNGNMLLSDEKQTGCTIEDIMKLKEQLQNAQEELDILSRMYDKKCAENEELRSKIVAREKEGRSK